jgi:hypothetical protein
MRASGLLGLVLVTLACRAERARRAGGGGGGGNDRHAAPDSAIVAALTTSDDRMGRRDWRACRASFWPRGTISSRWRAAGDAAPTVHVQTIDQFIAATKDGPDRLAAFEERMVHHDVMRAGDLALAWATFRARFGMPGVPAATHYGADCVQLVEDHGAWRIVSLAFTQERPGDSLPKDF